MVGGSREAVNRCLRKWQKDGLVAMADGRIVLPDPEALAEAAGLLNAIGPPVAGWAAAGGNPRSRTGYAQPPTPASALCTSGRLTPMSRSSASSSSRRR